MFFLKKVITEESSKIKLYINKMKENIIEDSKIIYENIDLTKFRDDIDF